MAEPFKIGSQIKSLSHLIMREIGNRVCCRHPDEATGNNMFIIGYLAHHPDQDIFQKDLEDLCHCACDRFVGRGLLDQRQDRAKKAGHRQKACGFRHPLGAGVV